MSSFRLRQFLASRFLSALADQFMLFAVPLLILKHTGSVKWSAIAFAIEWTPRLLFLPIAGSIADRVDVKRLYLLADSVRALMVTLAGFLMMISPSMAFVVLSVTMAVLSFAQSFAFIGLEATLPRALPVNEIPRAQSLLQACDQCSQVLGPAIAGLAIAYLDLNSILSIAAIFFGLSAINSIRLPVFPMPEHEPQDLKKLLRESYVNGLKAIRSKPLVIQLILLTWILNVIYGTTLIIAPAVITQTFQLPEKYYGFMQTSAALISISAMLLVPRFVKRFGVSSLGGLSMMSVVLGATLASQTHSYWWFAIGAVLVLGADGLFNVYIRTLRAQIIPRANFGRITGLIILLNNCSLPISGISVSTLSKYFDPQLTLAAVTAAGAVLFAVVLVVGRAMLRYPRLLPSLETATN